MVFRHEERDVVAAATRDGRVLLLDAASLGGANHSTPLFSSVSVAAAGGSVAGALSTWQEATVSPAPAPAAGAVAAAPGPPTVTLGARWILVPIGGRAAATSATNGPITFGGVVAYKLSGSGQALALDAVWTSHNLTTPATPLTVNGIVFALSTGRPATATGRAARAALHAYDGITGRALWDSGTAMAAWASPGSFWSAMGHVYVGTHDGTLYAFGFLDERR